MSGERPSRASGGGARGRERARDWPPADGSPRPAAGCANALRGGAGSAGGCGARALPGEAVAVRTRGPPAMKPVSWVGTWRSEAAGMGADPRPALGPGDGLGWVAERPDAATVLGEGSGASRDGAGGDRAGAGSVAGHGDTVAGGRLQAGLRLAAALPRRAEPHLPEETGAPGANGARCSRLPDTAAPKNVRRHPVPPGAWSSPERRKIS